MVEKPSATRIYRHRCERCGTCCQKGGPALHRQDKMLVKTGVIGIQHLFTIREGEPTFDNVKDRSLTAATDIIKIKSKQNTPACVFYEQHGHACSIYGQRPAECRALQCWDTRKIEDLYHRSRLTRSDLLSGVEGLWELVQTHQERCSYDRIRRLLTSLQGSTEAETLATLKEIISFDLQLRNLLVEKRDLNEGVLDFLFGRPMTETLPNYGLAVRRKGDKIILRLQGRSTRRVL